MRFSFTFHTWLTVLIVPIDPAPGAGRQSRAPLTGGSTISHSSADGPVYSATNTQTTAEGEFHWRRADIIFIC